MKKLLVFVLACMLLLSTAAFAASAELAADATCSHSHQEKQVQAATCEEGGLETYVCLDCGETVLTVVTPALGHNYVETVVEPTCEAAGYTLATCTNCGDSYAVKGSEVAALGHNFVTVLEATCAHEGTSECTVCHAQQVIAAPAHSYVYQNDSVTGQDGSIISYGTKVCSVCGGIAPASAEDYAAVAAAAPAATASGEPSGEASSEPASGEASEEAAAEEAATEVSNPDYDPYSYNWSSICWILVIAIVAIGAILMLSFGKKKPDEVHNDPLN